MAQNANKRTTIKKSKKEKENEKIGIQKLSNWSNCQVSQWACELMK